MQCGSWRGVFGAVALGVVAGSTAFGQPVLRTERVVSGLNNALFVTAPPGDTERLFVVEQAGRIRIVRNGAVLPTPFLDISSITNSTTWLEWGLLGLAFDPGFMSNGYFYVYHTDATGNSVVARYRVPPGSGPDQADFRSRAVVLFVAQPVREHRAGWMDFGPDGNLYVALGDGGPENDTSNNAQNVDRYQGKILRIDPRGVDDYPADPNRNYHVPGGNPFVGVAGLDEIWAYGLRNPWRCGFDRATGDLWIGDVGQSLREEVDFIPALTGGLNFGWRCTEGTVCPGNTGCVCNAPTLTRPVHDYVRSLGVSVTGGYVYRGCAIPEMQGLYFFSDWGSKRFWTMQRNPATGGAMNLVERTSELAAPTGMVYGNIRTFGQDALGELYFADTSQVFRIVRRSGPSVDCNENGRADACDLAAGSSTDANGNAVPDECDPAPCPCDWNHNSGLDSQDYFDFADDFFAGSADFNGVDGTDSQDLYEFLECFFDTPPGC